MTLKLRPAKPADLAYLHRLEHDPRNAPFIKGRYHSLIVMGMLRREYRRVRR